MGLRGKKERIMRRWWVYGRGGEKFVNRMVKVGDRDDEVGVVKDEVGVRR